MTADVWGGNKSLVGAFLSDWNFQLKHDCLALVSPQTRNTRGLAIEVAGYNFGVIAPSIVGGDLYYRKTHD